MFFCKQRRLRVRGVMLFAIAISVFSSVAFAQNDTINSDAKCGADTTMVYSMEEATVVGIPYRLKVSSPMPVQILSGADLDKLNSLPVADAIRYLSFALKTLVHVQIQEHKVHVHNRRYSRQLCFRI